MRLNNLNVRDSVVFFTDVGVFHGEIKSIYEDHFEFKEYDPDTVGGFLRGVTSICFDSIKAFRTTGGGDR